jgi:hypothetical protein
VLLLVPRDKVGLRQRESPGLDVRPLVFSPRELQASHWRFLMGAVGSQSLYLRQVNTVMRALRCGITLDSLRQGIAQSSLPDHLGRRKITHARVSEQGPEHFVVPAEEQLPQLIQDHLGVGGGTLPAHLDRLPQFCFGDRGAVGYGQLFE